MTDKMNQRSVFLAGAAIAALPVVGCGQKHALAPGVSFRPEEEPRQFHKIMNEQANSGARADGMLHAQHFDGAQLNSLGEQKLNHMMNDDDAARPMTVYVNLAKNDELTNGRTQAVQMYLRDHGLQANAFQVRVGANPFNYHPAQPNLSRLPKTENPPLGGGSSSGGDATVPVIPPAAQ